MIDKALSVIFVTIFISCINPPQEIINPLGKTIETRIGTPQGYQRIAVIKSSFAEHLRLQPLRPNDYKVHYYNGSIKSANVYAAVLTVDVGKRDLQQCADAIMRLRAEYLFKQKEYSKIHFKFTNGFNAAYSKWADGYRIKVSGNNVSWYKATSPSYSYESFRKYLEIVFTYAGTLSLSKEMKSVDFSDMQIGDVFIQGGSPGHAVIVVDIAQDQKTNKKLFMIAQSYMPAQEIHVLKNLNRDELSPWYDLNNTNTLYTPEWTFEKSDLKRFVD